MRGRASVEVAKKALEERGYTVVEEEVKLTINNLQVGEVDIIAKGKEGEQYAVEVKAGSASPSEVKQAYVNALILGAKPMIVARHVPESSRSLADTLGVEVIELRDLFVIDEDELYLIVKTAVEDALLELLSGFCSVKSDHELRILEAIAESESLEKASEQLRLSKEEIEKMLGKLRAAGLLPSLSGYRRLKKYSKVVTSISKYIKKREINNEIIT
ncbi:MAG: YraN family protein [Thermofilaceae archaeon]|nr:YraN family protein [Thermofilaceae archaeon]MCX8180550.1 YraN family protein [Thermofilaceae archaeon]MDW8003254.1 YraN family protein [Thermofilaceae archaeon]